MIIVIKDYKKSVLATGCPVISVEAGSVTGWARYSHYQIGMSTFGVSAPGKDAFKFFGFTVDNVEAVAKKVLTYYAANPVPPLLQSIQ